MPRLSQPWRLSIPTCRTSSSARTCRAARHLANRHEGRASFGSALPVRRGAQQLDRHRALVEHGLVELPLAELAGTRHFVVQGQKLPPADQIAHLVERLRLDETPHLAAGTELLVPHAVDEKRHHLLRTHAAEVILQREDHAGRARHPPEQHADAILGVCASRGPTAGIPNTRPSLPRKRAWRKAASCRALRSSLAGGARESARAE